MRHLVLVLGDQLSPRSSALADFDPGSDAIWMAEVDEEATHVWGHKTRLVLFFSAMRHFRDQLTAMGLRVLYHELSPDPSRDRGASFLDLLRKDLPHLKPHRVVMTSAGDHRVQADIERATAESGVPLEVRPDNHFCCSLEEFTDFTSGRRRTILEDFYRWMRRKHSVLMDQSGNPAGGRWNFDSENRERPPAAGLPSLPAMPRFPPDGVTREVVKLVEYRFARHPGHCSEFDLPVTREDALRLLDDFVKNRLPLFGPYQDCMWRGEPFLYHSRLASALNLKLIDPWECIHAALKSHASKPVPLPSLEGFVRQILGWREYIRCIYWRHMPGYQFMNHLEHTHPLPSFYWDGSTDMACVQDCMRQLLKHGYTHHIQRLMVLGLFALLYGANPAGFHQWHMAMYADAVDWVSLPNALGMSQYADGGIVGTKPYCATGQYIDRMSNYCLACPYDPIDVLGATACPFTTFYWDFLDRHAERLEGNPRMTLQLRNLKRRRLDISFMQGIRRRASELREAIAG